MRKRIKLFSPTFDNNEIKAGAAIDANAVKDLLNKSGQTATTTH